ncbi:MAG: hypothetical protein M1819_005912 [Sarea resinae]|nr:MAG: hypothetical protein M1819_005912 [Sarea resinae]
MPSSNSFVESNRSSSSFAVRQDQPDSQRTPAPVLTSPGYPSDVPQYTPPDSFAGQTQDDSYDHQWRQRSSSSGLPSRSQSQRYPRTSYSNLSAPVERLAAVPQGQDIADSSSSTPQHASAAKKTKRSFFGIGRKDPPSQSAPEPASTSEPTHHSHATGFGRALSVRRKEHSRRHQQSPPTSPPIPQAPDTQAPPAALGENQQGIGLDTSPVGSFPPASLPSEDQRQGPPIRIVEQHASTTQIGTPPGWEPAGRRPPSTQRDSFQGRPPYQPAPQSTPPQPSEYQAFDPNRPARPSNQDHLQSLNPSNYAPPYYPRQEGHILPVSAQPQYAPPGYNPRQDQRSSGSSVTQDMQRSMGGPPGAPQQSRRSLDKEEVGHGGISRESILSPHGYNAPGQPQPSSAGAGSAPPTPIHQSQVARGVSQQQQQHVNEQGRTTPPLSRSGADPGNGDFPKAAKPHDELREKYSKVKRLYFEREDQVQQLSNQIHQLQNTLANQRMSQSRTVLDDNEYSTRFNRLDGAINNLAFNIRKDWKAIPPWIQPVVNHDAHKTGTKEMTAVGRACISRWLADEIFCRFFHPALEPSLSSQLKIIEKNLRTHAPPTHSAEEAQALLARISNWRLTTVDGLSELLSSPQSTENRDQLSEMLVEKLTASLAMNLVDPPPPGLEGGVSMLVELAVGIAANLPLESRELYIEYPLPGQPIAPDFMRIESGLPPLSNPAGKLSLQEIIDSDRLSETSSLRRDSKDLSPEAIASLSQQQQQQSQSQIQSRNDENQKMDQAASHKKKGGLLGLMGKSKSSTSSSTSPTTATNASPNPNSATSTTSTTSTSQLSSSPSSAADPADPHGETDAGGGGGGGSQRVRLAVFLGVGVRARGVLVKAPVYV